MSDTWEASFGDVDLSPTADNGDVTVEVHGLKRSKHTRITAVADSLIQDGSIERVVRDDNRDVQLILCLDGTDSEALAQFEATLFREVNRGRNEFRWTPPDGFGATAVFDVLWADLAFADEDTVWDLDEIRGRRNYVLTLRCLPFARSVEPFTVQGATSGAVVTTVLIDEATSATGWSAITGQSGSEVFVNISSDGTQSNASQPTIAYAPASPVSFTDTRFLKVYWRDTDVVVAGDKLYVWADGIALPMVDTERVSDFTPATYNASHVTTFACSDPSVTKFEIRPNWVTRYTDDNTGTLRIDRLERTNQSPSVGTLRQKSLSIEVPGSARTPTSLEVGHGTSALGNVLVYTSPTLRAGETPALSPFRTTTTTTDATMVSGGRSTGATYDIPAGALAPGRYQLLVRADGAVTATASLVMSAAVVGATYAGVAASILLTADSGGRAIYALGGFNLPPHGVPDGSTAVVRIVLTDTASVDEAWLFHMPDDGSAHLSAIPAGTRKRVWLDAPTVDRPYPACYIGNATDRSDSFGIDGATSNWDEHYFTAGDNQVFVVTTTALDAQVEIEGHARWLTHPAA